MILPAEKKYVHFFANCTASHGQISSVLHSAHAHIPCSVQTQTQSHTQHDIGYLGTWNTAMLWPINSIGFTNLLTPFVAICHSPFRQICNTYKFK